MSDTNEGRATAPPPAEGLLAEGLLADLGVDPAAAVQRWTTPVGDGVFQLPRFDAEWCAEFLARYDARCAELERCGRRPSPPNSMHEGGAALDALGWEGLFDSALEQWLRPLAAELFPEFGGASLDFVYAFVAEYGAGGDELLGFHADNAEVTLNLCLGDEFEGSELYFRGRRCARHRQTTWSRDEAFAYTHEPGIAILHAGAHRHGVEWIEGGRRRNLILWLQSSGHREAERAAGEVCPDWCMSARGGTE